MPWPAPVTSATFPSSRPTTVSIRLLRADLALHVQNLQGGAPAWTRRLRSGTVATAPFPVLDWQRAIAGSLLDAGVSAVAYVPDARLRGVVAAIDPTIAVRTLTREEECVGFACGYSAAGGRVAVLMQCSGLGNALNALGSFAIPYAIGIPLVLSMRGTLGEENPSQVPMGRATVSLLAALGIASYPVRDADRAGPTMTGVLASAFAAGTTSALILEPELGGQREGG